MSKMWVGRTDGNTDKLADVFNSSISFDKRMYKEDITGSTAHALMLASKGIITPDEAEKIVEGLGTILDDIESGKLEIDESAEDIHMFVEEELTKRIGDAGKKLHTARSRNDQVALDLRMYLRSALDNISTLVKALIEALTKRAGEYRDAIMPGYTHLQRAQPVTFGHHLLAYSMMLLRDMDRIKSAHKRMNISPIGCCALAGTTYDTDRYFEAEKLGFDGICLNSMDGVSDRDFVVETLSVLSIIMMHLSRLSEELILWTSWEFGFVELDDAYTTGSSIMPQKKNSDMAELIRGKTGRVYGTLMAMLTVLKGLPLAYNKDMQEDKEGLFDALDTTEMCLEVMTGMISTLKARTEKMKAAASSGFINATDLADYLVRKGLPFRSAYRISGAIVAECMEKHLVLETFPLEDYRRHSELFDSDVYEAVDLETCVRKRISTGAPGKIQQQIDYIKEKLNED